MEYSSLDNTEKAMPPEHPGWIAKVRFSLWQGKRLYLNYTDYDRKGARRNFYSLGYVDVQSGEIFPAKSSYQRKIEEALK